MSEHPKIAALARASRGSAFPCPSCGMSASDDHPYPYCPSGCSEGQIVVAIESSSSAPPECDDHRAKPYRELGCLTCRTREMWVDREARRRLDSAVPDGPTGWEPVQITALAPPPEPSVCEYQPGHHLMTPGYVHLVYGTSETGKTWLAYIAIAQEVRRGNCVLIVDYEMGGGQVADRLRSLGLTDEQMDSGLAYVSPEVSLSDRDRAALIEHIGDRHLSLAVIDSMGEATTMDGLSGNDDADVVSWFRANVRWLVTEWPTCAVAVIDHLPKDRSDSPFPIGSQRKRAYPHVLLSVRAVQSFSREKEGHSVVTVRKSRDGRLQSGAAIARINGGPRGVTLGPVDAKQARDERLRDAIREYLTDNPNAPMGKITNGVSGNTTDIHKVLKEMVKEGLVLLEKEGRAHLHRMADDVVVIDL